MTKIISYTFGLLLLLNTSLLLAQQVTLNLKQVEIETLIQMVSEVTKKNFVVDERVKGKVTVISAKPMDEKELYQTFLSILSVHQYAAIPSGHIIKIVPEALAKSSNTPLTQPSDQAGDEIITQIIKINHISAAQLIPILRPLVPQQGHIAAHPDNNMIILSDRAANVKRMVQIIRRIDRADHDEVDVIMLQHAAAAEVVRLIDNLEQSTRASAKNSARKARVIADERTNSVLISGEKPDRLRLNALITHLDTPLEAVGNTQVIYLHYAEAKDLVSVLQSVSDNITGVKQAGVASSMVKVSGAPAKAGIAHAKKMNTSIQADESTNSLIITAAPDVLLALKSVIRQLDIRRAQVLVEAVIAEVESSKTQELGVQWIMPGLNGSSGPVGIINFGSPGAGIVDLIAGIENNTLAGNSAINGANFGAGRYKNGVLDFGVLLSALASDRSTNILSTPSLMTLDNQEALIHVGQNVPFITGQYTNTGAANGSANPFQTIQREDVGVKLKVKPQINEGNAIKLEIEQEVSTIVPNQAGISASDLVTNIRTLKTTVMIEDGGILVLGGLIDETLTDTEQKVPGLGDIPVLGALFRSQGLTKVKRNLMVFLHPRIVRDPATERQISSDKYRMMRQTQQNLQTSGVPFTQMPDIPVLPDMSQFLRVLPGDEQPVVLPPPAAPAS
ncbi:type II secretion system secretin GspD [Candidatus Venteria ishoeyi]|uniref:Type II secretion system protein D n=1 Tax=Candidatus Venteria ishoeyi TaxID=1899563 RepID=A0A1H6FES3_9GAMM|nr:type II secretion system secretin GspD [Candidatus Venteria ishoeyi]SEH07666.1 Type II secretion system protein D precursor [Candidatus Venteria ishoeyi]